MIPSPFSLRIFVADGDPDGLRIVERSNWVGRALVFPRLAMAQPSVATRPELQQTGVYLLLAPREDGEGDRLYIGEGDPIKPRLIAHDKGNAEKSFWTRAICFVSMGQALNKAHAQFLEANLISLAKLAKNVPLDVENKKNESEPTLSEADRADMQVFLQPPPTCPSWSARAKACWPSKAMTTLSRRTTPSAHPAQRPAWCWAAAPMGGWIGRMRRGGR